MNVASTEAADTSGRSTKRLVNLFKLSRRPKPIVGVTPADVIHSENKWRLLRYRNPRPTVKTPVLLVPSLINRHYVLDLTPGKSLVEFLLAQGHDVLCIDWGTPGPEDRFVTWDDVAGRWLGRAIRKAAALTPRNQVHVLGYCMGGTLAVAHAAAQGPGPSPIASIVALAAPVRFTGSGLLGAWTRVPGFDVQAVTQALGNVPWQLLQTSFLLLRPTLNLAKAVNLIDRAWNDRFLDSFLAMETWANDNVALPGAFYRSWITDVYQADGLWNSTLSVLARPCQLQAIRCPVLAIAFAQDGIAPGPDCAALIERISSKDKALHMMAGSHVGGVTSREAASGLWPLLSGFWRQRDEAAAES